MQLFFIKQGCQLSPVDEVNSNPIAYFTVSEEKNPKFLCFTETFSREYNSPHCAGGVGIELHPSVPDATSLQG